MRLFTFSCISLVALSSLSCSGGGSDGSGLVHLDGAAASPETNPATSTFNFYDVPGCGQAGYQTVATASSTRAAFATLAVTGKTDTCVLEDRTSTTADVYDICVVLPSSDGFAGSIVLSQTYAARMGVGLAMDKAGEPVLAYTGGPAAGFRCGGSDMLIASVSGGKLGTPTTIATGSQSTGMPDDQRVNCAAQDVCNQGDATGYWPSIALDPVSGSLGVAFRDMHFGFAADDFASSDVEFAKGNAYSVFTVDVARGGGTYNRLAFSPAGRAAIVHYNIDNKPAIWLDLETSQGWTSQKLFTGKIREQLGFAISAQGLYAVAFFDDSLKLLAYTESNDGVTWTTPEDVDHNGVTGYYPSLAFDEQGNPAIAYYRCGDLGTGEGCDANKDGLYLARRLQGTGNWTTRKLRAESAVFEGLYTALTFVSGKAVIAYQYAYYDPIATTSKVALRVAKEL